MAAAILGGVLGGGVEVVIQLVVWILLLIPSLLLDGTDAKIYSVACVIVVFVWRAKEEILNELRSKAK